MPSFRPDWTGAGAVVAATAGAAVLSVRVWLAGVFAAPPNGVLAQPVSMAAPSRQASGASVRILFMEVLIRLFFRRPEVMFDRSGLVLAGIQIDRIIGEARIDDADLVLAGR